MDNEFKKFREDTKSTQSYPGQESPKSKKTNKWPNEVIQDMKIKVNRDRNAEENSN